MLSARDAGLFRQQLRAWYHKHARELPWRGTSNPYHTWVSEVMLQQTRVAAVLEHYHRFLHRFPTILSLALASEAEVLAAWSGLGYYRRARMLHRAAQFITSELGGVLPSNSADLRTLPGVGEYTSAAIASIAFGENIAVVDGNVERVLLRVLGRPEELTAAARGVVRTQAAGLLPRAGRISEITPGDHNQAMMELGATICLPRAPLCLNCPVFSLCRTRGEHLTAPREAQRSRPVAYLLSVRKRGVVTEVLLEQRPDSASLMPGMYELPMLPQDAVERCEPLLRLRHSITNTNFYVGIYREDQPIGPHTPTPLRSSLPADTKALSWVRTRRLALLPLTGLCRKVLRRLDVMPSGPVELEPVTRGRTPGEEEDCDQSSTDARRLNARR